MDIVFLVIAIIAAVLLPRSRALYVAVVTWAICVGFVLWGPAHNSNVHIDSGTFWFMWGVVLAIGVGSVYGITAIQAHRQAKRRAAQLER